MFLDVNGDWPPPAPWEPEPGGRRLSKRDEGRLMTLLAINLALLFLAPLAGVTLIDAAIALFTR